MADTKISALPASTTPLAGTEVLPIVQSGTTKQVSVANLTAGRAISASAITASTGDITSTAGNFVVGTSGKGIDFSATPGTGTSELLADYEEGTFTATLTAETTAPTTPVTATGYYTKIGRQVTIYVEFINKDTTGAVGVLNVTGLPFTSASTAGSIGSVMTFGLSSPNAYSVTYLASSSAVIKQYTITNDAAWATVDITAGATKFLYITHTYFV